MKYPVVKWTGTHRIRQSITIQTIGQINVFVMYVASSKSWIVEAGICSGLSKKCLFVYYPFSVGFNFYFAIFCHAGEKNAHC